MTWYKKLQQFSTSSLCIIIAFLYALIAYSSLQLAFKGTNASPVWPPSGLAFVAVWFLGYRVWPGIWLGAFIANLMVFTNNGWAAFPSIFVSVMIGIGNSIESLLAVMLLRSFTDQPYFLTKIRDIFKFVFSVLMACVSSASIGTFAVFFTHPVLGVSFENIWFAWWLGDVVGMLVIASICLTFHKKQWQFSSVQSGLEAVLVGLVLITVNAEIFMGKFSEYGFYSHVTYLILPFAIWSTYRFGFPGASFSILTTSVLAIVGSVFHLGPFVGQRVPEDLVIVECFIGVITVTVMTLASALYERQKAEEDIKYNEARFRSLVENSFEVVAMIDTEARVLYTSPPTKHILGYDNSELLGRSMFEWMHPDDVPAVVEIFQGLAKTPGAIAHATCRMLRKDGIWRWMQGSGHNLLHDPVIKAVIINYRDITERKLFQERFEQAVEFSPVANIMVNKEGKIQLVNKATETLFGFGREELLNMKIESLVPEQFRGKHPSYREVFHQEPKARPMGPERELYALRKDGRQVPVEIGLTPIETEEGPCILASIVDITQRKRAEEILKRDKESLERLVDERSKELIKTQKELKQFSRLADIGTLAATVAHELRNPLGVIHLAAYNLKREKSDLNANKHLSNIEKKVWEGNQIIDNLLSYARIKIPNYENVRILGILDECVASAQGRFAEKGIVIEKKYSDGLDFIEADPNQIREIFLNVLNNACQAISEPDGKVRVMVEREGDMVKVSVQDTGVGIAQEDLDKVFEPFFTRKSKGTGLGLTICNELVNLHQGKIEINSRIGEGTTVAILLPLLRRNHAEAASD
jgi:PAS domain S-box-containing protein